MFLLKQNLEFRCESTKSMIDKMMIDLNRTSLRLENTSNKMLSLKNIQFMEARVHDETENNINTANKTNNNNITMSTASDRLVSFFKSVSRANLYFRIYQQLIIFIIIKTNNLILNLLLFFLIPTNIFHDLLITYYICFQLKFLIIFSHTHKHYISQSSTNLLVILLIRTATVLFFLYP